MSLLKIFLLCTALIIVISTQSVCYSNDRHKSTHFITKEVRFKSGNNELAGTVFLPDSEKYSSSVVILSGSDRSRRGPLRIRIAQHFARNNIVSLVYDSPGTGSSTGHGLFQNKDDRVQEALDALHFLKNYSPSGGIMGGSEGAGIAMLAGSRSSDVKFVIASSGSLGVNNLDVLRYSAEKKGYEKGMSSEDILKASTFKEILFVLISNQDIVEWPLIEQRVSHWNDNRWYTLTDLIKNRKEKIKHNGSESFFASFKETIQQFSNTKWFSNVNEGNAVQQLIALDSNIFFKLIEGSRYKDSWDNTLYPLTQLKTPLLAIWGEDDNFLPPVLCSKILEKTLNDNKHPDFEIRMFPKASHTLTKTGSGSEFVPGYLETMSKWIKTHSY